MGDNRETLPTRPKEDPLPAPDVDTGADDVDFVFKIPGS